MTKGSSPLFLSLHIFALNSNIRGLAGAVLLVAAAKSGLETTGTSNLCTLVQLFALPLTPTEIC